MPQNRRVGFALWERFHRDRRNDEPSRQNRSHIIKSTACAYRLLRGTRQGGDHLAQQQNG